MGSSIGVASKNHKRIDVTTSTSLFDKADDISLQILTGIETVAQVQVILLDPSLLASIFNYFVDSNIMDATEICALLGEDFCYRYYCDSRILRFRNCDVEDIKYKSVVLRIVLRKLPTFLGTSIFDEWRLISKAKAKEIIASYLNKPLTYPEISTEEMADSSCITNECIEVYISTVTSRYPSMVPVTIDRNNEILTQNQSFAIPINNSNVQLLPSTIENNASIGNVDDKLSTIVCIKAIAYNELPKLLLYESWLILLLSSLEYLPISVMLTKSRGEKDNYPIIYTNNYFEKITGYQRNEIMNENNIFLNYDNFLLHDIESKASRETILMNIRCGLSTIQTLNLIHPITRILEEYIVSFTPIYNYLNKYTYVLVLAFDLRSYPNRLHMFITLRNITRQIPERFSNELREYVC